MKVVIEKEAVKALARMQPKTAGAISAAIKAVAAQPFGSHSNAKALKGYKDGYRLRHSDWRIVYRLDTKADTMFVEWIGPRGGAYK